VKFIIFGSSGFIGSSLSRELATRGKSTFKIDKNLFLTILADIRHFQKQVEQDDVIIFAAGKVPARTIDDVLYNLKISEQVSEILDKLKFAYFLNFSSDAVYPSINSSISENTFVKPQSMHGIAQFSREILFNLRFEGRLGHIRSSAVYGIGDTHNSYGPNRFLHDALAKGCINLFGNGQEIRDHIYIKDLMNLAILMINRRFTPVINAVSGQPLSFLEVSQIIQDQLPKTEINFISRGKEDDSQNFVREFDTRILKEEFPSFSSTPMNAAIYEVVSKLGDQNAP
jgi:nucleoside-diphosphate-sugar epimerase